MDARTSSSSSSSSFDRARNRRAAPRQASCSCRAAFISELSCTVPSAPGAFKSMNESPPPRANVGEAHRIVHVYSAHLRRHLAKNRRACKTRESACNAGTATIFARSVRKFSRYTPRQSLLFSSTGRRTPGARGAVYAARIDAGQTRDFTLTRLDYPRQKDYIFLAGCVSSLPRTRQLLRAARTCDGSFGLRQGSAPFGVSRKLIRVSEQLAEIYDSSGLA